MSNTKSKRKAPKANTVKPALAAPTGAQFTAYQRMYDHFNAALFAGALRPVILNFSRHANSYGFFAPDRWHGGTDTITHEISLNPSHLRGRDPRAVVSTLVHEMVHCWQQESGKPSKRGYHNQEWAEKMEAVGLYPSSTGAPGGDRVGYRVSHYVLEGGAFAQAFAAMPREYLLPWMCSEPTGQGTSKKAPVSKLKYSCPGCAANAWGKPGLYLRCGDCEQTMGAEKADADAGTGEAIRQVA